MSEERPLRDDEVDVERISAYLDSGRAPYDATIEESPEASRLMREMAHLRDLGARLIASEADALPEPSQNWFAGVLSQIALESRSGRDLPLDVGKARVITEGALRGAIRQAAGARVPGLIVERCVFEGELDASDSPVTVSLRVALVWPTAAPAATAALRRIVQDTVSEHLGRVPERVDIRVDEVHVGGRSEHSREDGA
ncbi:hypothetical protein [Mycetocola reblochoni]|uniref:Asp23/Gls24 family envelope stress response protein n=2 Tax=Mycetocola reblochoni TaxID=331618 RepID=A0A1R4IN90_9MICO|nr:hypothetical protein [Mycetocola reblochoni]RLP67894.1 hypothetical protein D9V30_12205 [Mycetocola reblochoni]SJN21376.1 hypothetical protein FM119_02760 [Mycetocola reblochoni REB411]